MDFIKSIAWWVWLIIAGLLGVVGYGVYYYISKNALAKTSEEVEDGATDAPDNDTPSAPDTSRPSKPAGGGGFTDNVVSDIELANASLPIVKRGVGAYKAKEVANYTLLFNNKAPYQKSGQVQWLQQVLIIYKFLPRGSDDGVLGLKTAQAIFNATKKQINVGSTQATIQQVISIVLKK